MPERRETEKDLKLDKLRWENRRVAYKAIFVLIRDIAAGLGILLMLVNAGLIALPQAKAPSPVSMRMSSDSIEFSGGSGRGPGSALAVEEAPAMAMEHHRPNRIHLSNLLAIALGLFMIVPWIWNHFKKKKRKEE